MESIQGKIGLQEEYVVPQIDYETFEKIDLRTASVLEAQRVKGADRLLKLDIALGDEERTIVAGIAQSYSPEEIKGKTIIVVANLKPATIWGVQSHGMLLAVSKGDKHSLVTTDGEVSSGLKAK